MKIILQIASLAAKVLPNKIKTQLYKNPKLAEKIRSSLNAAAPLGLTQTKIAGGLLEGFHLNLDMQTEKDYWLGTYEVNLQNAIKKYCQTGTVVYDIGANIGYISLIFAKQVGAQGKVIAFEPLPENFKRLAENVSLNNMNAHVTPYQVAMVDKPGETTFFIHKSGAMGKAEGSLGREEKYLSKIKVEAVALDDFIFTKKHPHPDLIKMDIEGGEVLAIQGMRRTLTEIKPIILVEIHSHTALECLWKEFQSANYSLYKMEKGYPLITDPENLGDRAYAVAIPNKKAG